LMVPWEKPLYLTRVWCVFECYTAIDQNCNLTILMPPDEKNNFAESIMYEGVEDVMTALSGTRIEDAKASREDDKVNILRLIESGKGFDYVNGKVNERIRMWIDDSMMEVLKMAEDNSNDKTKDLDLVLLYNGIGLVYDGKGDFEEALKYYKQCIAIYEKELGTNHVKTAVIYNNIGSVYNKKGDYEKALSFYKKCMAIKEKVYGTNHVKTAQTYNNIGLVYEKKGDYEKALSFYKKCMTIEEKVYGTNHVRTAVTYNNIGMVYWKKGDNEEALSFYKKCMTIYEKVYGTNHVETAVTYNNIGLVYENTGDVEEASKLFQKAVEIRERVLGTDHPDTVKSRAKYDVLVLVEMKK